MFENKMNKMFCFCQHIERLKPKQKVRSTVIAIQPLCVAVIYSNDMLPLYRKEHCQVN